MRLSSRAAKMCSSGHNKRPRSAGADGSSDEPVKSLRRAGMDRALPALRLTASELEGVPVPRRAAAVSEFHGEPNI